MEKITKQLCVKHYSQTEKISQETYSLEKEILSSDFDVASRKFTDCGDGRTDMRLALVFTKNVKQSAVAVEFNVGGWSKDNYVFAPAALYDGNRFYSVKREYAPYYTEDDREKSKQGPVITDVPRLNSKDGAAQLAVGDLSTPCVGWFSVNDKKGHFLFFKQKNEAGLFGLTVKESNSEASFTLTAPCMREKTKYGMCTTDDKSDDKPLDFKKGDRLTFEITQFDFDCESKVDFLNKFFEKRALKLLPNSLPHRVPWSYAFEFLDSKYNERDWVEKDGFYKGSEATSSIYREWQTGWIGGGMNLLPQLFLGTDESVEKSKKTLDFMFGKLQHPSGFLYGVYCDSRPYGDCFDAVNNVDITMSRKNGDALYFVAKELLCLKNSGREIQQNWHDGLKKLADAFISYYEKNGELSQFIDMGKMEPYVAKTVSAAITPAGLALCSVYFGEKAYLDYACKIADEYYNDYVIHGFTNGGPGEILGCPDSESAFGMLESTVALYEITKDEKWIKYSKDVCSICSSWCVSYDYEYEKDTQFARRKIATNGAVWASVQNKHGAPGICTLSGVSLFRLFRATGDIRYLELCRDISHNITQFLSTPDDPIYCSYVWNNSNVKLQKALSNAYVNFLIKAHKKGGVGAKLTKKNYDLIISKVGCMGERCNLSDWEGKANVGELPGGSCWCEVSTMLIYFEIPAIYANPDTGFVYALDHVECQLKDGVLTITNPTNYDANYRIFAETSEEMKKTLNEDFMLGYKEIKVKAHQSVNVKI